MIVLANQIFAVGRTCSVFGMRVLLAMRGGVGAEEG
jgi:hypothetical protein